MYGKVLVVIAKCITFARKLFKTVPNSTKTVSNLY